MRKTDILGVNINNLTMQEAVEEVKRLLTLNRPSLVFTPNSEIIYAAKNDSEFRNILNSSDLNTPDGIGVVYASKILSDPMPERVPGFDLACNLFPFMNDNKLKLFLFGGKEGVAELAAENILKKYPQINIVGKQNGYFNDSSAILEKINSTAPDFLFVCLGAPKQEKWMHENKDKLNCKVMMGVGGTLDVLANTAKRAPDLFIKLNIEWLYRLIKNPSRIGRMMALPKFGLAVLKYRIRKKEV